MTIDNIEAAWRAQISPDKSLLWHGKPDKQELAAGLFNATLGSLICFTFLLSLPVFLVTQYKLVLSTEYWWILILATLVLLSGAGPQLTFSLLFRIGSLWVARRKTYALTDDEILIAWSKGADTFNKIRRIPIRSITSVESESCKSRDIRLGLRSPTFLVRNLTNLHAIDSPKTVISLINARRRAQ